MSRLKIIIILLFIAMGTVMSPMSAQKQPSRQNKSEWMKEMRQVKNEYIVNRMNLNHEQRAKFIPLYNKMEAEVSKCIEETNKMARQVRSKGSEATDLEYEKAAEAMFECKSKEGAIEMKYYNEFKKILTPTQLYKLKKAEREFTKKLMKEHRKMKKDSMDNKRK